jgi:UDPglucose 6-dehydrogenase
MAQRLLSSWMKIAVLGLGCGGLSNAVLLARYNVVIAVDITQAQVDLVNFRRSPIVDA